MFVAKVMCEIGEATTVDAVPTRGPAAHIYFFGHFLKLMMPLPVRGMVPNLVSGPPEHHRHSHDLST